MIACDTQNKESKDSYFPVLQGSYLGQSPPGLNPIKFAEGIISTDSTDEGCSGFLLNQTVFVFQRFDESSFKNHTTFEMVLENGEWTRPKVLEFSKEYKIGDFTIAPDGKTMYFESKLEIPEIKDVNPGGNVFKITRTENGWSKPMHLGLEVNTEYFESYPCIANNGTLYFF